MPISVKGCKPRNLEKWGWVGKSVIDAPAGAGVSIPATTTQTVASVPIKFTWSVNQAIYIRRFVTGVADPGLSNAVLYFGSSLEVQITPFGITTAKISNDSEMLTNATTNSAPNAQTLSDMSQTLMLRDDWYEWDDYAGLSGGGGIGPTGIQLQGFWRLRNTAAGAVTVFAAATVLFDTYEIGRGALARSATPIMATTIGD